MLLANSEAPTFRLTHAPAAGPEAWSNLCRKLGFVVLKEVRQQYLSRTYPATLLDIIAGANQRGGELLVAE